MRTSAAHFASQSYPAQNYYFRRRWANRPMTPRELEHLADLEMAQGNGRRADALSWKAHVARTGAQA